MVGFYHPVRWFLANRLKSVYAGKAERREEKLFPGNVFYDRDDNLIATTYCARDLARNREELNVKTFFTRPCTSQDKGSIENRNSVIKGFYPKKTCCTYCLNTAYFKIQSNACPLLLRGLLISVPFKFSGWPL